MKKSILFILIMGLMASTAFAWVPPTPPSPYTSLLSYGVGVRWDHSPGQELILNDQMWVGVGVSLPLNPKVKINLDFQRDATKLPQYQMRAGIWFKIP